MHDLRSTLFLRDRIPAPDEPGVQGVVIDASQPGGLDTLAGYADGTARYLNFSGRTIIWEPSPGAPTPLRPLIDRLLAAASGAVQFGRPLGWTPPNPEVGDFQVTVLTRGGLIQLPSGAEPTNDIVEAGAVLMQAMIATVQKPGQP